MESSSFSFISDSFCIGYSDSLGDFILKNKFWMLGTFTQVLIEWDGIKYSILKKIF
jgi:hypothetical protein